MYKSIKSVLGFSRDVSDKDGASNSRVSASVAAPSAQSGFSKVSEWANLQGFRASEHRDGSGYRLQGSVGDKPWRMEQGYPSRDFIRGQELRARGEMNLNDDVAVLIMSRQLKSELDERLYAMQTSSLQTMTATNLPEEMRWLAMYEEYTWDSLGDTFFHYYAVLADEYPQALAWVNRDLAQQLMDWPELDPTMPKILMLLRGKVYLRMQVQEDDLLTIEHATGVFTTACELAVNAFEAR